MYKTLIQNAEFRLKAGDKSKAIQFYRMAIKETDCQDKINYCNNQIDLLCNKIADEVIDESLLNDVLGEIIS